VDTNISSLNVSVLHSYVLIFSVNVSSIFEIHFLITLLTLISFISLSMASNVLIFSITLDVAPDFSVIFYVFLFEFFVNLGNCKCIL